MKHLGRDKRDADVISKSALNQAIGEIGTKRVVEYATFGAGIEPGDPWKPQDRRILRVQELTGVGFLHLDFKVTASAQKDDHSRYHIGRFDKWYPANTLEVMLFDGSTIWNEGQNIYARCEVNKRYIVDLNGFYRK